MRRRNAPLTLAIDIGGTGLKASVLDGSGRMIVPHVRTPTPHTCRPEILLQALSDLVEPLPKHDRISIGFPGVVRDGRVITAPHFNGDSWHDYPLEEALSKELGGPARMLNDAEVQGLGIVSGKGLEVVLTLGTGVGTAVFSNGHLTPHLELAHHPIRGSKTYNDYIGNAAKEKISHKKWKNRLRKTIDIVSILLNYDILYLGGGNAAVVDFDLPDSVRIASNDAGITGGLRLWDAKVWTGIDNRGTVTAREAPA